MVFSFENPPHAMGVHIGTIALEDRELALPELRDCVEDVFADCSEIASCSGDSQGLYSDVFAKLAWSFLEKFNSETLDTRESVTLSFQCPWSLQVGVVNSDAEYFLYLESVNVHIEPTPQDDKTPEVIELDEDLRLEEEIRREFEDTSSDFSHRRASFDDQDPEDESPEEVKEQLYALLNGLTAESRYPYDLRG